MIDKNLRFRTLVDRARHEPVPPIDIAGRVATRLEPASSARAPIDWSLWSAAALSVTAAVVVLLLSLQQGVAWDDPLVDWLHPLMMVMQ